MSFRPVEAKWFELVTTSVHVARALDRLARSGAVELEVRRDSGQRLFLPDLGDLLSAFHGLARDYASHWPAPRSRGHDLADPRALLERAWNNLSDWRAAADGMIARSEALAAEQRGLELLRDALERIGDDLPDPRALAAAGPLLDARLIAFAPGAATPAARAALLVRRWTTADADLLLFVGPRTAVADIVAEAQALKGRFIPLPGWLPATPTARRAEIVARLARVEGAREAEENAIRALTRHHGVAEALADFGLFEWLGEHANDISGSARLVHITGWTSEVSETGLQQALDIAGIPGLIRLSAAPADAEPPLILRNPRWAKNFELFARMLGIPARNEADPSVVLAIMAPLLFGFMFGDVGQGLVLALVGALYGRRLAVLRLLLPGGIMAMVFGLLFGSVFCVEGLIPHLWFAPLDRPVDLLVVALAFGVVIIVLGLALNATQALWRGEAAHWFGHEAGLVFAYGATLAAFLWRPALWGIAIGAVWYVAGAAVPAVKGRLAAGFGAFAELLEQLMQILVNTVSFARVGAFALAHAGLSAAVVGVAEAVGGAGFWIVLVFGNLLVLTLEGLVVGIQTTRLLLFEFFIRFLKGGGREFKPLAPPRTGWLVPGV